MPENDIPAAQPEPEAAPGEFDFAKPSTRLKRRSLKAKTPSAANPGNGNGTHPAAAIEPDRDPAPVTAKVAPDAADLAAKPQPTPREEAKAAPTAKAASTPLAPPRTLPAAATTQSQTASATAAASSSSSSRPVATSTSSPTTAQGASSPHGTRPATLYYSSYPRKEGSSTTMKTVSSSSPTSPSSTVKTASTVLPSSAARPATASATPASASSTSSRPAGSIDYRANVERQSREQKSVGNILSYIVYGFIAMFVIVVGLAGYGANVIFKQLHDQSVTVTDLDSRYAAANKDLNTKLATTQETLTAAQAQISRQQELIIRQQEDLDKLIAATTDNASALKQEKLSRAQETANLRARVRDLEERSTTTQKL